MNIDNFSKAINAWKSALQPERVLTSTEELKKYRADTTGISREIPAALLATSKEEVVAIVKIASQYQIPLYPISMGNNWGYGTANPATDGSVILDLSKMNTIVDYDAEVGTITVQPGVTQQILADFLFEHGDEYLTPTTGAGPEASILGNALERGYGLTPVSDHFLALMALEAILPDGQIYHSALHNTEHKTIDQVFKWGVGPYIDGIFTQGNFGIVTQITIQLAPRPEKLGVFIIEMKSENDLERTVVLVREVLRELGGVSGSINLMNALRLGAMSAPYPFEKMKAAKESFESILKQEAENLGFAPWTCVGSFYGRKELVQAANQLLKEKIYPYSRRVIFLSRRQLSIVKSIADLLPGQLRQKLMTRVEKMHLLFDVVEGRPTAATLPLCYRKLPEGVDYSSSDLNPARDGCGLIWYAPLVPMKPTIVRTYVNFVEKICNKYRMEPLITLTSLSSRCFDSTVPILFDPRDKDETTRAQNCFNELFQEGWSLGFYPYRLSVDKMKEIIDPSQPFWNVQNLLKKAIDPQGIIAPGRYSTL